MSKSKFLTYLEYTIILIVEKIITFLPSIMKSLLVKGVSYLTFCVAFSLRKFAKNNLEIAFGKTKTSKEINEIRLKCFLNLGKLVFEILGFSKLTPIMLKNVIHFSGESLETIKNLSQKGKGIIVISAHYGNWELLGLVISYLGFKLNIIYRPLENDLLNGYINDRRKLFNSKLILRKNSFIEGSKALKNNELLAFLIDQNQARGGIFVPFFGKLASSPRGPALMAKRFKSPVMGTYIKRNPDSTHTVTFKEIKLVESSSIKEYLYTNTYNFSNFFEELIRENPDQWYWFHNRWKTQTKVRYGKDNLV